VPDNNRNQHSRRSPERPHQEARKGAAVVVIAALFVTTAIVVGGCGPSPTAVCSGTPANLILVPSTSKTDDETSIAMTPKVSKEVVRRAAESCGTIRVGIQNGRPEADLVLQSTTLVPEDKTAFNTEAKTKALIEKGDEFVQAELLRPLEHLPATGGSPFLSTLVKVGEEMTGHGWKHATIVLVGDGLVVERPPDGGKMIRFGVEPVAKETVEAFVPLLRPLRGSCVILAGAGAGSKLTDGRLRESQKVFGRILEAAGVEFVSTRSPDLPRSC
jgi:hypothetical protein